MTVTIHFNRIRVNDVNVNDPDAIGVMETGAHNWPVLRLSFKTITKNQNLINPVSDQRLLLQIQWVGVEWHSATKELVITIDFEKQITLKEKTRFNQIKIGHLKAGH